MRNPFRRRPVEQRSVAALPWGSGDDILSPQTVTQDRALRLAPVFAANRFLADFISTLPLKGYRRLGDQRQPMAGLPQLLQFLSDEGTIVDWLTRAVSSLSMQGNAIGFITSRDGFGYPTGVFWRPVGEFSVDDMNPAVPIWYWMGRQIRRDEIVHIPWITLPGRTLGLSPIEAFALTVNQGISAQEYGTGFMAAGGIPPGTFKNSEAEVTEVQAGVIKNRLVKAIKSRAPIVYGRDWDFTPITIPPEQAQFVQTQRLTANQIASIYGIDPTEIGGEPPGSLTYSTEESRQLRRVSDVRPWLVRLETALSALLPERQYVRFNADAVVRADAKTRWEINQIERVIGTSSIDEIRAREDRPPLPDGQGGGSYAPLSAITAAAGAGPARGLPRLLGSGLDELTWVIPE
jgi:HK97 family phage portal protein